MKLTRGHRRRVSSTDSALARIEAMAAQGGMSVKDILDDSVKGRKQLNVEENLVLLILRAIEAFGGQKQWNLWLRSPCDALKGKKPLEVLISAKGLQRLHTLLDHMGRGVHP